MARNPICLVCGSRKKNLPADLPNFLMKGLRCPTPERHEPDMLVETVCRAADRVMIKRKLAFEADVCGARGDYPFDSRIVTLQYADGTRFIIRLTYDGLAEEFFVSVNDVRIPITEDSTAGELFFHLSLLTVRDFDTELARRMKVAPFRPCGRPAGHTGICLPAAVFEDDVILASMPEKGGSGLNAPICGGAVVSRL